MANQQREKIERHNLGLFKPKTHEVPFINYLYALKQEMIRLSQEIKSTIPHGTLNYIKIEKWLQLRNAINAYYVCLSFQRGALAYKSDPNRQGNPLSAKNNPLISVATSLPTLERIHYLNIANPSAVALAASYKIKHGANAAQLISELVFSSSLLESNGVIQIVRYKTLLDLLTLIYGKQEGSKKFNHLFNAKNNAEHDFYQLRLGNMGDTQSINQTLFSPIHYFTKQIHESPDLLNNPNKYVGTKLYVGGNKKYAEKHPQGESIGLNVIFFGLNENKEPLFLCARYKDQRFIVTYNELLEVHAHAYNLIPEPKNCSTASLPCMTSDILGLANSHVKFDMEKIKLLVSNFKKCDENLNQFCTQAYFRMALQTHLAYVKEFDEKFGKIDGLKSKLTQDDTALHRLPIRLFHFKYTRDALNWGTQDDSVVPETEHYRNHYKMVRK